MGYEQLNLNFQHFKAWQPFEIPPFRIQPYLMDHSSSDAFGFLIEVEGKRLFYSGDFRAHGSKEEAFETFLKKAPKEVVEEVQKSKTYAENVYSIQNCKFSTSLQKNETLTAKIGP